MLPALLFERHHIGDFNQVLYHYGEGAHEKRVSRVRKAAGVHYNPLLRMQESEGS